MGEFSRPWRDLSWRRLITAAIVAPLLPLYIGFAAFLLAYSDRNLSNVLRILFPEPQFYAWGFGIVFALLYLSLISRLRGRIGMVECIVAGSAATFLLAESFFLAVELDIIGPVPYMTFFPGIVLSSMRSSWFTGGAFLGLVLAPAGALAGWIFWRIGVASAPPRSEVEVF